MKQLLSPVELRKVCSPGELEKNSPATFQLANIIIGQERATKALKFGINIKAGGFNIYAAGLAGTGKLTAVKRFVEESSVNASTPSDWCYVNNFSDNYEPKRLSFPKGKSGIFRKEMKDLIQDILQTLIKAFESEEYADRRSEILDEFKEAQAAALESINERAAQESFTIKQTPWEIIAIPMIEGEAVTDEQFNNLPIDQQDLIKRKQDAFLAEIKEKLSGLRKQEKEANRELNKLEKEVAVHTIGTIIEEISQRYKQLPEVAAYIKDVQNDILDNLPEFLLSQKGAPGAPVKQADSFLKRYEVNVLVDNSNLKGAPVIIEHNPTYNNLLGRVEKESYMGTLVTDFTMIRKGSLHSANGGYLILRVEELLRNYLSWDGLKRALKNKEIVIEDASEQLGLLTTRTLKPQPVPLDVKVILIGHPFHYQLLYEYEPEFKSLFKVKADFDSEMLRNEKNIRDYVNFTKLTCSKEKLLMPDTGALAKMVEYGSRLVNDQQKLSTRFDVIADVLREANHYAMEEVLPNLFAKHISKAIEEKAYRSGLIREKIHEMIATGQIFIDITGSKTGQLNGLSVLDLGDISIGRPNRITCSISLGKEGVVAIEREAELSGPIHTKGVMILTGYLTEKYLRQIPASLTARLVFEQSYSEIEGDSASSTELYAILSNLSGLPIRQGIAVTGSVNQKGEIQAIGGVNEKIEGYFEVCKQIGLNGEQGVLIPAANKRHLMLKEEVVTAVEQKKFFIWAIETVDEGIEILTGVNAGAIETEGSVAFLVNKSLHQYASKMKEFLAEEGKNKSENNLH